ncbi:MAG: hypothetical protein KF729_35135, partial [Sandaracinaceae bacterium]|nr:hypothetical protein [Sandaracinaceae bacterium]
ERARAAGLARELEQAGARGQALEAELGDARADREAARRELERVRARVASLDAELARRPEADPPRVD